MIDYRPNQNGIHYKCMSPYIHACTCVHSNAVATVTINRRRQLHAACISASLNCLLDYTTKPLLIEFESCARRQTVVQHHLHPIPIPSLSPVTAATDIPGTASTIRTLPLRFCCRLSASSCIPFDPDGNKQFFLMNSSSKVQHHSQSSTRLYPFSLFLTN
ncbi:hypothetical protein LOAG_00189 [Loa loa]|uniref:Uncharacterized protein n=1 Tax=Loa loa TaxID=7209 RepID=A0A1S0UDW0_LOALO|nr:hypothetical protein LOAG_00189 [Loa loa]EFO28296.1 hypothetical protein LOAG_00189 [Loa loa]